MTKFTELALSPALQERLAAASFHTPTSVQAAALPPSLAGEDVLATAQTGTGKTLAFLIPAIERLERAAAQPPARGIAVLILTPTRELAMQIAAQYERLRSRRQPQPAVLVGGLSERPQLDGIRRGARLVVATPGRLEDFLKRGLVRLDTVGLLVLDEADRMLDIGFLPAIRRIVALLPKQRQTLCYSATLAPELARLAQESMRQPRRLALDPVLKPAAGVSLRAFEVGESGKMPLLEHLLGAESGRCLVFARTKRGTERLAKSLVRAGHTAAMIHGNRSQSQRSSALLGFQRGTFRILVATDVASRGIHVEDVAHVVNYDLPEAPDDFVHRVGRTARAGATGIASTFIAPGQHHDIRQLEKQLGIRLERLPVPAAVARLIPPPAPATAPAPAAPAPTGPRGFRPRAGQHRPPSRFHRTRGRERERRP